MYYQYLVNVAHSTMYTNTYSTHKYVIII